MKSPVRHKEPIMGSSNWPYRETGTRASGPYPWWAFCISTGLPNNLSFMAFRTKQMVFDTETPKKSLRSFAWIGAIFLFLMGVIFLFDSLVIEGILSILASLFLLPPLVDFVRRKGLSLSRSLRISLASTLAFVSFVFAIANFPPQRVDQPIIQTQAPENDGADWSAKIVPRSNEDKIDALVKTDIKGADGSMLVPKGVVKSSSNSYIVGIDAIAVSDSSRFIQDVNPLSEKILRGVFGVDPTITDAYIWYYANGENRAGIVYHLNRDLLEKTDWNVVDPRVFCQFLKLQDRLGGNNSEGACNILLGF